jgi:hypothetical protein
METATVGDRSDVARLLNLLLGGWLFISAFLWPHARHAETDTWMMGTLIATFAVLAAAVPAARRLNTVAAVCLLLSTLLFAHREPLTLLNNALVAIAVFALSLPGTVLHRRKRDDYVDVW